MKTRKELNVLQNIQFEKLYVFYKITDLFNIICNCLLYFSLFY